MTSHVQAGTACPKRWEGMLAVAKEIPTHLDTNAASRVSQTGCSAISIQVPPRFLLSKKQIWTSLLQRSFGLPTRRDTTNFHRGFQEAAREAHRDGSMCAMYLAICHFLRLCFVTQLMYPDSSSFALASAVSLLSQLTYVSSSFSHCRRPCPSII